MVSIIATGYFGKEATQGAADSTPGEWTVLADVVAAFTISDVLGINVNFDYIKDPLIAMATGDDHQLGISAMGRLVLGEHAQPRAPRRVPLQTHFMGANREAGRRSPSCCGLPVGKNFELRPEFRGDFSGRRDLRWRVEEEPVTGTLAALTYF